MRVILANGHARYWQAGISGPFRHRVHGCCTMSVELVQALQAVVERFLTLAAGDPEFKAGMRALAEAMLSATQPSTGAAMPCPPTATVITVTESAPLMESTLAETSAVASGAGEPASREIALPALTRLEPHLELTLGQAVPRPAEPPVLPAAWMQPSADGDLHMIEDRCRLKAQGARWANARNRRLSEGADFRTEIEPRDREIIDHAKGLPDCFLWMNHPNGPNPEDPSQMDDVAGCFEVVATAIDLVRRLLDQPDEDRAMFEQALDLLAEAQSALRAAIFAIDGSPDRDQQKIYNWLRTTTVQQQVFIQRYMRADDPADPKSWPDIDARVQKLDELVEFDRQKDKRQQARIKKVRYHANRISGGGGTEYDWRKIAETLDEMVADGVPPSNREVRELLLPIADDLPDLEEVPSGFERVLRELDRFLATRASLTDGDSGPKLAPEVKAAAQLLQGTAVVLIGGDRRPRAQEALQETFGLKELDWIETREHQSLEPFESHVARSDVSVVLLAIRWSSHSFGDVKQFCDRYGKPLVRLPAGYSPNQVAVQVLQQCSDRLVAGV